MESCFKTELAPILDLVLCFLTNAPCYVNVSHGGERGVSSSKNSVEDKGKVVGKVTSTQIPTLLSMKPVITTFSTTTYVQVTIEEKDKYWGRRIKFDSYQNYFNY